jgi:predicted RNA-binding protein with PUA-like domain
MKQFWLVKSEPSTYSWQDFLAEAETSWTGVRNYTARNNLRKMGKGDEVFFYHSGDPPSPKATARQVTRAVVGIARVTRTAYADKTAKDGDWSTVDLAPIKPLRRPVTLAEIKKNPCLKKMPLVRLSRLSVSPVTATEFREIVRLGR